MADFNRELDGTAAHIIHEKDGELTLVDEDNPLPTYSYSYPFVDVDVSITRDANGYITSMILTGLSKTKTITFTRDANDRVTALTIVIT